MSFRTCFGILIEMLKQVQHDRRINLVFEVFQKSLILKWKNEYDKKEKIGRS